MKLINTLFFAISLILLAACQEPIVDNFENNPQCQFLNSRTTKPDYPNKDTIKVMTFNIRFGIGSQILWFADACSDRTIYTNDEIFGALDAIVKVLEAEQPDIVFLQEVDSKSKRTGYIDELQYLLDKSYFKYSLYGSQWSSQFIASDGLGRMNVGNAILSRWPIKNPGFIILPERGDIDYLTSIFYDRENIIYGDVQMPDGTSFRAINTHISAFSTDGTKKVQVQIYYDLLKEFKSKSIQFVTGGDFNLLPPNSDSSDYCDEDMCSSEHYHGINDTPFHKDGSNYLPEMSWLQPLFDDFNCSMDLNKYFLNQRSYFTHTTLPKSFWDRTLDYLFASSPWIENSHQALQKYRNESDHAPVTAKWVRSK